ncbi:MAG: hypothetical protein KF852_04315 [Saprospiraceae bacterium]|nr:hypothetical protein [Saprospiraceae bacterium]
MKTVNALAAEWHCHPKTVRRRVAELGGTVQNSIVYLPEGKEKIVEWSPALTIVKEKEATAPKPKPAPTPAPQKRDATQLFRSNPVAIVGALILISADALSFSWIAFNTYHDFQHAAAAIFALTGFAVGYSAIKNIITYKGWNADAWAWGFGIFQLCLHLCAMEVFGEYSFTAGKVIIAVGLPLAVGGLATSMKDK